MWPTTTTTTMTTNTTTTTQINSRKYPNHTKLAHRKHIDLFVLPSLQSCTLGGSLAKIIETTCDKKIGSNIFIIDKSCEKHTYNIGGVLDSETCLHVKYHHI